MIRAVGVAAGFALGAGVLGVALNVGVTLATGRLPSDAEGSMAAAVLLAAIAFGSLAVVGGMSAGVVIGVLQRWFFDVSGARAIGIGVVAGISVALSASFGMLRFLRLTQSGSGALVIPAMLARHHCRIPADRRVRADESCPRSAALSERPAFRSWRTPYTGLP